MSETTTPLILNAKEQIHSGVVENFSPDYCDLKNIGLNIDDENNAPLLLNS